MEWTRGEWGGVTDIGEREAGERKFPILFLDWTSGDFKEKKKRKKSDRCSRCRVSACPRLETHTHTSILAFFDTRSKKRIHPTGHFHSHFRATNRRRYHCLTPGPGNLEIGVSDLRPPRSAATSRERKR